MTRLREPTALETNLARTFAALSATNEAILYAKSPEDLYRQVCEAAFSSGEFLATAVFLLEPETNLLRLATGFGEDIARLRSIDISIAAGTPEGSGVCGQAFRDRKICISNDFLNDPRSLAWRQGASEAHVGAAAALPLTCNGRSVGVLLVTRREAGSLTDQIVSLLERMSANISYALDIFDHLAARKSDEQEMRRLNRMFGALSATNEAIMRAKSRAELFDLVCEAAVQGAKFSSTTIALAEPNSEFLRIVASNGPNANDMWKFEFAITDRLPQGRGLTGTAFRTRQPCISNDFLAEERTVPWHDLARRNRHRVISGAAAAQRRPRGGRHHLQFDGARHVHARVCRAAAAACGERRVRPGKFRPRRRKSQSRKTERSARRDVRGAQRDQRSDHAGQDSPRAVRTGVRGGCAGRYFRLRHHRACRSRVGIFFKSWLRRD